MPGFPEQRAMVRGLAALFGAGATLVALTVVLPHGDNETQALLLAPAALAYLVAIGLIAGGDRIGKPVLHVALASGTAMIALGVVLSGRAGGAYAFMFVWVGVYAAVFFGRRAIALHLAWAGALYAAALAISGDVHPPGAQWLMALGTSAVATVLVYELTRQVRARARDLAAVGAIAADLGGAEEVSPEEGAGAVCDALLASAGADAVVLLETQPDEQGLHVLGMAGSADAAPLLDTPAGIEALDRAFGSGAAVPILAADERRVLGVVQPVLREGRTAGLLAAVWRRPRRSLTLSVAETAALFAGQASVAMERVERQARERERRALEINDEIVQGLVVAKYAIEGGRVTMGQEAIDDTLGRAKALVSGQIASLHGEAIAPGALRRRRPS